MIHKNIKKVLLLGGRRRLYFLLSFSIFSAFMDAVGVVSIMPFMTLVSNPGLIETNDGFSYLYSFFEFTNQKSFVIFSGVLTLTILLTGMVVKTLNVFFTYKFALRCEGRLSQMLFRHYLLIDYADFLKLDRSNIERQVLSESTIVANNGVLPIINIFSQGIVVLLMIFVLLWVDVALALISAGVLSSVYMLIYKRNLKVLSTVGRKRIRANDQRFKTVAETFINIRDLKLRGCEEEFDVSYVEQSSAYVRYQATSSILAALPRFVVEGLAFGGMIAITLFFLVSTSGTSEIFPIISLYALAGYRLIPALQLVRVSATFHF